MPVRLPDRCGPDCIAGFRAAAMQRCADAVALASNGRRTAAIYLWGYAVEMWLKAAYFTAFRYRGDQPITATDLRAVIELAPSVGVAWAGRNLHHLPSWARMLIETRQEFGLEYPTRLFSADLIRNTNRVYLIWRETLRYHPNVAYDHEVGAVRRCVDWFRDHADSL